MTGLSPRELHQIEANRIASGICPLTGDACGFNRDARVCCEDGGHVIEPPQPNQWIEDDPGAVREPEAA